MESVGAFEAKTRLSELLERVAKGEMFVITKHGHPVARLVPERSRDPQRAARAAERLKDFHKGMPRVPLQDLLDTRHEGHRF